MSISRYFFVNLVTLSSLSLLASKTLNFSPALATTLPFEESVRSKFSFEPI